MLTAHRQAKRVSDDCSVRFKAHTAIVKDQPRRQPLLRTTRSVTGATLTDHARDDVDAIV